MLTMPRKLPKVQTVSNLAKTRLRIVPSSREFKVRQMIPGEKFPFKTGIEYLTLNPQWVWVLVHKGKSVAVLAGCDGHKMFILMRIIASKSVKPSGILLLLRQAFRDAEIRGCFAFTAFLVPDSTPEMRLLRIATKAGANILPIEGAWVFSYISKMKGLGRKVR
jgi:hypothetical protein